MPQNTTPQAYELTFILGERATTEEVTAKTEEVKTFITSLNGSLTKEESWGRRELAYPIKKNRSGHYVTLWFDLPRDQVKPLEQQLRFDESVIRSLVTKAYTEAQPGSLSPVEESKPEGKEDRTPASGEEMVRRSSSRKATGTEETVKESISEEERLKKVDESLEQLLKEE